MAWYAEKNVEDFINKVCSCKISKHPARNIRAALQHINATMPFETVSIDFLHLEKSKAGHEYILIVMDHFTRFVQAYPTRNKSGETVADRIFKDYIMRFGFPGRIHHDQGGEFENNLFKVWVT